jgi:hypothetical protein
MKACLDLPEMYSKGTGYCFEVLVAAWIYCARNLRPYCVLETFVGKETSPSHKQEMATGIASQSVKPILLTSCSYFFLTAGRQVVAIAQEQSPEMADKLC